MRFENSNSGHQIVFLLGFPGSQKRKKVEVIIHWVELSFSVVLIWTAKLGTMASVLRACCFVNINDVLVICIELSWAVWLSCQRSVRLLTKYAMVTSLRVKAERGWCTARYLLSVTTHAMFPNLSAHSRSTPSVHTARGMSCWRDPEVLV